MSSFNTVADAVNFFQELIKRQNLTKRNIEDVILCHSCTDEILEDGSLDESEYKSTDIKTINGIIADFIYLFILGAGYDDDAKDFCCDVACGMTNRGWCHSLKELKDYLLSDTPWGPWDQEIKQKYRTNIQKNL